MPRPRTKTTVDKTQDEQVDFEGTVTLKVGIRATIAAAYTSVGVDVGAETTCPAEKRDKVYEKLWDLVNSQASTQLEDAEETLKSFISLKNKLERNR